MNYIKAILNDPEGNENVWIKEFNPSKMTGVLDNTPMSRRFSLGDKVKIKKFDTHFEIVEVICPNRK
jgi:hypothetical protein